MILAHFTVKYLSTALLAAAIAVAAIPVAVKAQSQTEILTQANAALQAGEADKAVALLASGSIQDSGVAHNLLCRVRLTLEQWDAAAPECEQAVHLDAQNSDFHLWLGRALGQRAAHASFLTAFSLAKRTCAEFEEAVRLNPRNAEALADLGNFDRQAPAVVGGGIDKAPKVASQLDKVDPARAHQLRGDIAEQQKDFSTAESELKQAIAAGPHPAVAWTNLASFYSRRQRFPEMETAIHSAANAVLHDKHSSVALYDGAGLLAQSKRDPAFAASLLDNDLSRSSKTEEAPAFIAHIRLARLKQQLGDPGAADRERAAALALAHDYKPAQEFKVQEPTH